MTTQLTHDELELLLEEQLNFIDASAVSFDGGCVGEIKRLAISVRVLVHDTATSTSLLKLMGRKNVQFLDTALPFDEANKLSHSSLVQTRLTDNGAMPEPVLDGGLASRHVDFDSWWNGIVFVDRDRNEFSRRDIVLTLANKEGGAHVDPRLDVRYAALRKQNSLGWMNVANDGKETPSEDQVPAAMRQISHEILKSLRARYETPDPYADRDGVVMMGASVVEGDSAPPIPDHNLVKNRPHIGGRKIGRNDRCPCGSGKKYKKCCLSC